MLLFTLFRQRVVQEGDHLASGAGLVGGEGGGAGAVGDAVLHGPKDGLVIRSCRFDVGEGAVVGLRLRASRGAPEEGHHLAAGAEVVDAAGGPVAHAAGDLGVMVLRSHGRATAPFALCHAHETLLIKNAFLISAWMISDQRI